MTEKKKIGIIVQARQGSTRLPGKALADVHGRPLLWYLLKRMSRLVEDRTVDKLVLAVPATRQDEALCRTVEAWDLPLTTFRGDEEDVLERFMAVAHSFALDVIVRVTGDNPLTSTNGIAQVIDQVVNQGKDYAKCSGFPLGMGSEAFTFKALRTAWREADNKPSREHVTPYIYHRPGVYNLGSVTPAEDFVIPGFAPRLTVDTPEDLKLFTLLVERAGKAETDDPLEPEEAIAVLRGEKGLMGVNARIHQKRLGE